SDSVPRLSPENFSGFLEVHLEQGKELEDAGVPLGIVTHIASPWRWWIRVRGEQGHTGGAAMADRRDALAGAADLVLAAEHIGNLWEPKGVRVTVGVLRAYPGLINSIAGLVELGVDLRGTDTENVVVAKDALFQRVEQIAVRRNLRIESEVITEGRPYAVPPRMVDLARKAALEQGIQAPAMISWSAHDAMHMGRVAPSGLLFVRNKTGVSHHPEERVRPEDLVTGTLILRKLLQKCSESSLTSGSEG
ncbi:MAG: M20/M25/M40 family metallo-hydrolase, partial [Planifilum fulgidum]